MKPNLLGILSILLVIEVFSTLIKAQETGLKTSNEISNFCGNYKYANPEDFRRRQFLRSEARGGIEKYLENFLKQCSNSSFHRQAKGDFKIILEESAEHRLSIAKYYLKIYEEQKRGFKSAYFRLKELASKYSNYSRIDEVLFLLVRINILENNFEEGAQNYRKLFEKNYLSEYVCRANDLLRQNKQPK